MPNHILPGARPGFRDQYLTPLSVSEKQAKSESNSAVRHADNNRNVKNSGVRQQLPMLPKQGGKVTNANKNMPSPKVRVRRLRSASCEDLSDYLRLVVYDPISKSTNDLLDEPGNDEGEYLGHEPFPRLQSFPGVVDNEYAHSPENYYNIEGLKGKIYDGPSLPFVELRKKFSKKSISRIRRSVSNPNFIESLSLEKLNLARVNIGITHPRPAENTRRSSLVNILPEALKKHLSPDSSHKGSHSASSSGAASKNSSRTSSAQASPYNSLSRKNKQLPKEEIVGTTSIKSINLTRRSRSFRRQKPVDGENAKSDKTEAQSADEENVSNAEIQELPIDQGESSDTDSRLGVANEKDAGPRLLNVKGTENDAQPSDDVKLTLSDTSSTKQTKPTPKIRPKPSPKPSPINAKSVDDGNTTTTV